MRITKKVLSCVLAITIVLGTMSAGIGAIIAEAAYSGLLHTDANGDFTILQVGDVQSSYPIPQDWLNAIKLSVAAADPDLIVMTGDNVTGYSNYKAFTNTADAIVDCFKDANGNAIPFAVTFGNHDNESASLSGQPGYAEYGYKNIGAMYQYFLNKGAIDYDDPNLTDLGTGYINVFAYGSSTEIAQRVIVINSGSYSDGGYGRAGDLQAAGDGATVTTPRSWVFNADGTATFSNFNDLAYTATSNTYRYDIGYYQVVNAVNNWTNAGYPTTVFQHIPLTQITGGELCSQSICTNISTVNTSNSTVEGNLNEVCSPSAVDTIDLYYALAKPNVTGIFYGHDHSNTVTGISTFNGVSLRQGYGGGINTQYSGIDKSVFSYYTINSAYNGLNDTAHFSKYSNNYKAELTKISAAPGSKTTGNVGTYISNLRVSQESSQSGFTKLGTDLNDGAGGKYIYLYYQTTNNSDDAVTDMAIRFGGSAPSTFVRHLQGKDVTYTLCDKDLNTGAGGKYIYLYWTKDPAAGQPITGINITKSDPSSRDYAPYRTANLLYDDDNDGADEPWITPDLNKGAGGDYIYITFFCGGTSTSNNTGSSNDITLEYYRLLESKQKYGGIANNNNDYYTAASYANYAAKKEVADTAIASFSSKGVTAKTSSQILTAARELKAAYKALERYIPVTGLQLQKQASASGYAVAVPETIYLTPNATKAYQAQWYLNDKLDSNNNVVVDGTYSDSNNGKFELKVPTDSTSVQVNAVRMSGSSFNANGTTGYVTSGGGLLNLHGDITTGTVTSSNSTVMSGGYTLTVRPSGGFVRGTLDYMDIVAGNASNASNGLAPGSTCLIEWRFTVTRGNGDTETLYAYSVVYAPLAGANSSVATQTFQLVTANSSKNREILNWSTWIAGVHMIETNDSGNWTSDSGDRADKKDNCSYNFSPYGGSALITKSGSSSSPSNSDTIDGCYTESTGNKGYSGYWWKDGGSKSGTERKQNSYYKGTVYYDKDRVTNLNQIPNIKVGSDVFENWGGNNGDGSNALYCGIYKQGSGENTSNIFNNDPFTGGGSNGNRTTGRVFTQTPSVSLSGNTTTATYIICGFGTSRNNGYQVQTKARIYLNTVPVNKSTIRASISAYQTYAPQADWFTNGGSNSSFTAYMNELISAYSSLGIPTSTATTTSLESRYNAIKADTYMFSFNGKATNFEIRKTINGYGNVSMYIGEKLVDNETLADIKNYETVSVRPYSFTGYTYKGWMDGEGYLTGHGASSQRPAVTSGTITQADIDELYDDFNTSSYTDYGHITSSMVAAGCDKFYFYYQPTQYTLTLNYNGGTFDSVSSKTVTAEQGVEFNISLVPVRTNYVFDGWALSGGGTLNGTHYVFGSSDATLTAQWRAIHTITYNSNGGSAVSSARVTFGDSLPSPTTTRTGYDFTGWSYVKTGTTTAYTGSTMPDYDLTATAAWESKISGDTFVVDSGVSVLLNVTSNDGGASGITGFSATENGTYTSTLNGNGFTVSISNGKALFSLNAISSVVSFWYKGSNGVAQVKVIPATNVYYEESFITFEDTDSNKKWSTVGNTGLTLTPLDALRSGGAADSAYGQVSANTASNSATYSLGTAKKIELTSTDSNKLEKAYAEFTFTGTGFNVYSLLSTETGYVKIVVTDNNLDDEDEEKENQYVVSLDNGYEYGQLFYKDGDLSFDDSGETLYTKGSGDCHKLHNKLYYTEGETEDIAYGWLTIEATDNETAEERVPAIYQSPAISKTGLPYSNYTVRIIPKFNSKNDINKNGKCEFYFDSVRIYDPINPENLGDDAASAYMADKEYAAQYKCIRTILKDSNSLGELPEGSNKVIGIAFLGTLGKEETSLATYLDIGPKNEVYLGPNDTIAFNITTESSTLPAKLALGMKLAYGSGTGTITVNNQTISTSVSTEQYRNVAVDWSTENNVYVASFVITNTSSVPVSLTNFRYSYSEAATKVASAPARARMLAAPAAEESRELTFYFNDDLLRHLSVKPDSKDDLLIDYEDVSVKWSDSEVELGKSVTLSVECPEIITKITADGQEVTDRSELENGKKEFKFTVTPDTVGNYEYDIVLFDRNGYNSKAILSPVCRVVEPKIDINDVEMIWNSDAIKLGESATLTLNTNEKIKAVIIGDETITDFTEENGRHIFTRKVTPAAIGKYSDSVVLQEIHGYKSTSFSTPLLTVASYVVSTDGIEIKWNKDTFEVGEDIVLTVKTPADIKKVTADGQEITDCEENSDGTKTFTLKLKAENDGKLEYAVRLTDENGMISKTVSTGSVDVNSPVTDKPAENEPAKLTFWQWLWQFIRNHFGFIINLIKGVFPWQN